MRLLSRILFLCVACCLFQPVSAEVARAEQADMTFATFPNSGITMVFRRVLDEAYGRLDQHITIREYPAERALLLSNSGEVDGEAGRISIIEETYPNLIRVPTPVYQSRFTAFVRRDDIDVNKGWVSLKPYRVGVLIGFKFIEAYSRHLDRVLLPSYEKLFAMLEADRLDVVVMPLHDGLKVARDMGLTDILALMPPLAVEPMYHYLHPKRAEMVPEIDQVLRQMEREGELQRISDAVEKSLRSQ